MVITNAFAADTVEDPTQSFVFTIQGSEAHNSWVKLEVNIQGAGSKTIQDLPIGKYTVTPSDWAWRYTPNQASEEVAVTETKESDSTPAQVVFHQTLHQEKWLDGNGADEVQLSG